MLFIVRLLSRIEGYVALVLGEEEGGSVADPDKNEPESPLSRGGGSAGSSVSLALRFGTRGEPPDYYHIAVAPSAEARSAT